MPTDRVTDYASLLSAADRGRLEALLAERERATGVQMVIAIFRSLDGENLEDFSIRLAQQWRIGQKGLDNGVILLVFVQDRKVRLEVGYGLEPVVTDAVSGRIIREVIAPRFREGRYAAGLEDAVHAVFNRVGSAKGREIPVPDRRPSPGLPLPFIGFVAVMVLVAIVLLQEIFSARRFVGRNAYTGGRRGWDVPIIMAPPWWGRGGGWGGGFGGGGGFSGGGGGFGGGGASGGW